MPITSANRPLEEGIKLEGVQGVYELKSELGHGGRGQTWKAIVAASHRPKQFPFPPVSRGNTVVIKSVRIDESWPSVEVVDFIARVNRSLTKELYVLSKLKGLECVAQVFDSGHHTHFLKDGYFVQPMFIVQGFVRGERLDKYLEEKFGTPFTGLRGAAQWFAYADEIARCLVEIHQREVVHRDIWINNLIFDGERDAPVVSFIDFGEAVLRHECSSRERVDEKEHTFKAPERGNDWLWPTRRADIYAVGGVFYYLATGLFPPKAVQNDDSLKETIIAGIRAKNPSLLAENAGIADIVARCMRFNPTNRVRDADALREEIDVFGAVEQSAHPLDLSGASAELIKAIKAGVPGEFFSIIAAQNIQLLAHRIVSMANGVLDLSGDHEEIVSGLTRYLSCLQADDEYLTVSIPEFWLPKTSV